MARGFCRGCGGEVERVGDPCPCCGDWTLRRRPGQAGLETLYWTVSGRRRIRRSVALMPFSVLPVLLAAVAAPVGFYWAWGLAVAAGVLFSVTRWPNEGDFEALTFVGTLACMAIGLVAAIAMLCGGEPVGRRLLRLVFAAALFTPGVVYLVRGR